ncbi:MAG: CapA family protein [Nocardioides sp.]|uniref:CapA family protein n=1 Tax=Nocardioides sp. TaxID=35761 RepID=UPI0039E61ED6
MTVAISGDILIHDNVWTSAQRLAARDGHPGFDFRPMLANLKPLVSGADLALCHLETPLAPRGPADRAHPRHLGSLRTPQPARRATDHGFRRRPR